MMVLQLVLSNCLKSSQSHFYVLMMINYHHGHFREYKSGKFYLFISMLERKINYILQVHMSRKKKKNYIDHNSKVNHMNKRVSNSTFRRLYLRRVYLDVIKNLQTVGGR